MACETAFRIVALRYLGDLTANHDATCKGDPVALHQMRVALTRLRTVIVFFSPMVADSQRTPIRDGLKWLNAHLGAVRDLDVAIERLGAVDKRPKAVLYRRSWGDKRADSHSLLAQALQSARYRRLIKDTSTWIENGPWSARRGTQTAKERAAAVAEYGVEKLARWQEKILKKSGKLLKMDAEKRHQLRLLNKKLSYSIEALEDLRSDEGFSRLQAGLKQLRKAQRALGQLNDDERARTLTATVKRNGVRAPWRFIGPKSEKNLLQTAATAYRKLAALET
jgi:CHAD domain-containing protein